MSYLSDKRCYLSGPIENDTSAINWRIDVKKKLKEEFNINLFDPYEDPKQQWTGPLKEARTKKDYDEMARIAKIFVRKDLAMVDRADFIVSYLPYKVATTGTHHEIINSANAKKPALLVCEQGKEFVPLWYYGFISSNHMFGGWEQLYSYLREVNKGAWKDDWKWAFVYGLV